MWEDTLPTNGYENDSWIEDYGRFDVFSFSIETINISSNERVSSFATAQTQTKRDAHLKYRPRPNQRMKRAK